ncbi:Transmembrane protein of unknown function (DUF3566) [Streptoalloteichus tenebrarius]|uniref:DUF3566 domain-containing protein n=1 Tax=Streptoalloteichus tenebrarius (strain ATCC 17920 / DSM 40477 / JCM 4838 / CBS 697.72 / NBRC 16177 / NCIMB 11028 / NRRL B-12390 / A12253. 1 / ISP 5477) TaxID=1933 RepID=A0ABT1I2W9_STRSD|nr:DUF3566 domain-containing protein [Streptoalloteichus tenebrarius]MCP2262132.1 Transmembrane protein of unknown function (DUF3566) [Streptoalloteichus tenebrarius]BFF01960.1 DUF3566 domain-containing protein [Streptoalloteichus tenebrarius]
MTAPQDPNRPSRDAEKTSVITHPAQAGKNGTPEADGEGARSVEAADQPTVKQAQPVSPAGGTEPTSAPAGDGEFPVESGGTPPWQRVAVTGHTGGETATPPGLGQPPAALPVDALTAAPVEGAGEAPPWNPDASGPSVTAPGARASVQLGGLKASLGSSSGTGGGGGTARRPGRGPRRASLQVKRIDPWSVLKLALVLSVALFFVWLVAVGVLYGVLDGMGVWDQINGTYTDLVQSSDSGSEALISAGRVFGVAAVIGAINIVLFTALATVSAFVYNVSADLVGGVEVTLSERE